ncbi:MAG: 30S ribosomal protein S16 [Candidatus Cloacimonetes bacterium 4572_65]|nr:MAG: 30S ribosomal protein S16 [Candidatus Cloacimonetes bacterium 4572_65]
MVKLRLRRMGASNRPFYRIVAVDARVKRDGKYIESVGYYDPMTKEATIKVDTDKVIKWLEVGAQPTDTVRSIFRKSGILELWHNMKLKKAVTTEDN